ncbi:secreted frizzled-related protein 3 [Lingula anatina]|uniref:Secreted frizzled-related protein 3 n=1 Tax=Lingula anatina TaxID=7574 RepID=A0A1S3K3H0_LINAN|nr:secreted frizzled-related protein 3 [Lingula anatina]|eukprot:XP_013417178.1 secreted frizzled-related protein 3 [Lingula anatina]
MARTNFIENNVFTQKDIQSVALGKIVGHSRDMMKLSIMLLLISHLATSSIYFGETAKCEPVRMPMCADMPYNMTRMPNLLHHSTQENAILAIEQYEELVNASCSDALVFFLCSMYAPICAVDFQSEPIPPCRSVCERSRQGCEPLMNEYNVSWPESLNCNRLPMYDRGVCISPEAIVSTMPSDTGKEAKEKHQVRNADCNCPKKSKLKKKQYLSKKYEYVVHGVFKEQKAIYDHAVTVIDVKEVLKNGEVEIKPQTQVQLWTKGMCVCAKVEANKEYLFLGHEDKVTKRLLLNDDALVLKWKKKVAKKLKRWESRKRRSRGRGKSRKKKGNSGKRSRQGSSSRKE